MKIDKTTDIRLFEDYEFSKKYRKLSTTDRLSFSEYFIRCYANSVEYYASQYCICNGIDSATIDEIRAYWLKYNLRINDMLYLNYKVEYVSEPFFRAAEQNATKLLNSACESSFYELLGTCAGTMLLSDYFVQYAIQSDGVYVNVAYRNSINTVEGVLTIYGKNAVERGFKIENYQGIERVAHIALAILVLKKYGEVETVLAAGNTRRTLPKSGDVFVNRAPFAITHLDSSWLRTIVRTEGFLVRGHFRLQACGEKHRDRKLIYINPFQKHGYVRRAKKLVVAERVSSAA